MIAPQLTTGQRGDDLAVVLVLLGPIAVVRLLDQSDEFVAGAGHYARIRLSSRKDASHDRN